jgi:formamidopyrimidine-DNA glycosylase
MPELVEVEVLKQSLDPYINAAFSPVYSFAPRFNASEGSGCIVKKFTRKGKFLIFDLGDEGNIILHLGMSGSIIHSETLQEFKHVKSIFMLDLTYFYLIDPRGFGRFNYVSNNFLQTYSKTLSNLGLDVLDSRFNVDEATELLFRALRNKPIKQVLLEQEALAGVGNYIADESLYLAKIHPVSNDLNLLDCKIIVEKVQEVAKASLKAQGLSIKDYKLSDGSKGSFEFFLKVYSRVGEPCFSCGSILEKIKVASRSSTFCPSCQRK